MPKKRVRKEKFGSEKNFQFAMQAAILALLIGVMIAVVGNMRETIRLESKAANPAIYQGN